MNHSAVSLFNKGPVLPVDPLDRGEMALSNKSYAFEREIRSNKYKIQREESEIERIYGLIRDSMSLFKFEDEHINAIDSVVKLIDESMSESNSLLHVGSSVMKGLSPLMLMIPGVDIAWGLGTYAIGMGLDALDMIRNHTREDSLSQNRFNIFENIGSTMSEGSLLKVISRLDDAESRCEKFGEWMHSVDQRIASTERVFRDLNVLPAHLMQFWGNKHNDETFFIIVFIQYSTASVYYIFVDLKNNVMLYDYVSASKNDVMCNVHNSMDVINKKKDGGGLKMISTTNLFAPDETVLNRITSLKLVFNKFTGDFEERRTAILMYLQLGLHISRK